MIDKATKAAIAARILEMGARRWTQRKATSASIRSAAPRRGTKYHPSLQLPTVDERLQMHNLERETALWRAHIIILRQSPTLGQARSCLG
jgi:hypothetical protein